MNRSRACVPHRGARFGRFGLLCLLGLALTACSRDSTGPRQLVHAILDGVVLESGVGPISGAFVRAIVYATPTCEPASRFTGENRPIRTGADGVFSHDIFIALVAPFEGCVRLLVEPPPGSSFEGREVEGISIFFRNDSEEPMRKSVVVHLERG